MTTLALPTYDVGQINAMVSHTRALMSRDNMVRFKAAGQYRLRFYPQGGKHLSPAAGVQPSFWKKYGVHLIPRSDGQTGSHKIVCNEATYDKPCPVDARIGEFKKFKKAANEQGKAVDSQLENLIGRSNAGTRFVVNATIVSGPQNADPNAIVPLDLAYGQFETVLLMMQINPMLFLPDLGSFVNVMVSPNPGGRKGFSMNIMGVEPATPVTVDLNKLLDLDIVVEAELRNASPAELFTGDFFNPLPVAGALLPSPTAGAPLAIPAHPGIMGAGAPSVALPPAPAPTATPPVQTIIQPSPAATFNPGVPANVDDAVAAAVAGIVTTPPAPAPAPVAETPVAETPEQVIARLQAELAAATAAAAPAPAPAPAAPAAAPVTSPAPVATFGAAPTPAPATPVASQVNPDAVNDLVNELMGMTAA